MARNNHIINSFVAGEASPKFFGRTETGQYNQACEDLTNMLVYPQGGCGRRPGTQHIAEILTPDDEPVTDSRAIPFFASDGTRWQLIITPNPPDAPTGYTPGVSTDKLPWLAYNTKTGEKDYIYATFEFTVTPPNYNAFMDDYYDLSAKGVNLSELQYAQSGDTLFIVHGKIRPIRIKYVKREDVHSTVPRFTMTSYPDTLGALTQAENELWRQSYYLDPVIQSKFDYEAIDLSVDGSDNMTIEPSAGSLITFNDSWNGRYIKFTRGVAAAVVMVYDVDSPTSAKVVLIGGTAPATSTSDTYGGTDADYFYESSQWDDVRGWPRTVCFFDDRLVFGGSPTYPDNIWFTRINNIDWFDQRLLVTDPEYLDPITSADSFTTTLRANVLNEIRWMSPSKTITVGTNYREFVVSAPSNTKSIAIDNIQTSAETPHGSAYVQAVRIENTTAFLQRHRRAIRELVFNLDENSFQASNLNIIGEHIAKKSAYKHYQEYSTKDEGYIIALAMQEVPLGVLWCLDNNGRLCSVTRERQQQVNAWHYHEIAGLSKLTVEGEDVDFSPFIQSISVIQAESRTADGLAGEPDELWMTVARGVYDPDEEEYVKRVYLERMSPEWEQPTINEGWDTSFTLSSFGKGPVYMDFAHMTSKYWETDGAGGYTAPLGTVKRLPHSIGSEVDVVCNGKYFGKYTVTDGMDASPAVAGGSIDFSDKLGSTTDYEVIIGYNYIARNVPVVPELPAQTGSAMGQDRRIHQIVIHFYRTIGARFGLLPDTVQAYTPAHGYEEIYFKPGVNQDDPIPMFSGDKRVDMPQGYETRPKIVIESHLPFPMQVTHIVAKGVVYE